MVNQIHRKARRLAAALASISLLPCVPATAAPVSWDVFPVDPAGATSPEVCPAGGDGLTAEDALLVLRRAVDLVTGFACFGLPMPEHVGDVAPLKEFDASTSPPTATAGGDGEILPEDALLLLRATVGLIDLVPGTVELGFTSDPTVFPSPAFASDVDLSPLGNFPGPEDRDEGNGVLDLRRVAFLTEVAASEEISGVDVCLFDTDPQASPAPAPLACQTLDLATTSEVAIEVAAPSDVGLANAWLAIDPDDQVSEVDETDNVQSLEFPVFEAPNLMPDLAFRGLTPLSIEPTAPGFGELVTIIAKIANVGTAPVRDDFFMDLFFDPEFPPDVGNCGRFERVAGGVEAGEQLDLEILFNLGSLSPGPHALWAVLDSGAFCPPLDDHADILESSESNNATFSPHVFCVATPNADPQGVVDLRADTLAIENHGGSYTVTGSVSNVGTKDLLPTFASPPLNAVDIVLTVASFGGEPVEIEQTVNCLVQNDRFEIGFDASFPVPTVFPTRVEFDLDPTNRVNEADETNNSLCIQVDLDGSAAPCE
jgi:hypothetical protein